MIESLKFILYMRFQYAKIAPYLDKYDITSIIF